MRSHARAWLPAMLVAAAAVAFLVYGSVAGPREPPRIDQRRSTVLASGIVASVVDGDTVRMADGRRIRLVQIDAPELTQGECYAEQAWNQLERLLPIGAIVLLRADRALDEKDGNGRLLAYVLKDRKSVNLELVEKGAAAPYFFQGDRGRHADALMAAARRAKVAKRGLWGACPRTRLDPERQVSTRP